MALYSVPIGDLAVGEKTYPDVMAVFGTYVSTGGLAISLYSGGEPLLGITRNLFDDVRKRYLVWAREDTDKHRELLDALVGRGFVKRTGESRSAEFQRPEGFGEVAEVELLGEFLVGWAQAIRGQDSAESPKHPIWSLPSVVRTLADNDQAVKNFEDCDDLGPLLMGVSLQAQLLSIAAKGVAELDGDFHDGELVAMFALRVELVSKTCALASERLKRYAETLPEVTD